MAARLTFAEVARTVSQNGKATTIEERTYEVGNRWYETFKETGSPTSTRLMNSTYRVCLLAMRDIKKFHPVE